MIYMLRFRKQKNLIKGSNRFLCRIRLFKMIFELDFLIGRSDPADFSKFPFERNIRLKLKSQTVADQLQYLIINCFPLYGQELKYFRFRRRIYEPVFL